MPRGSDPHSGSIVVSVSVAIAAVLLSALMCVPERLSWGFCDFCEQVERLDWSDALRYHTSPCILESVPVHLHGPAMLSLRNDYG